MPEVGYRHLTGSPEAVEFSVHMVVIGRLQVVTCAKNLSGVARKGLAIITYLVTAEFSSSSVVPLELAPMPSA